MRLELVLRGVQHGDAHDHKLPHPRREAGLLPDRGEESEPALGDRRAVEQHPVEVEDLPAALGLDARGERGDVGPFGVGVGDAGHDVLA